MDKISDLKIAGFVLLIISVLALSTLPGYLGEWQTPLKKASGYHPHGICAGDLDGNGYTDIAIANSQSNNVTLYTQNASGWDIPQDLIAGTNTESVIFGDVYGDSNLDLIIANAGNPPMEPATLTIYPGNGAGLDAPVTKPTGTGTRPVHIAVGDLNKDGHPDLAVADKDIGEIKLFIYDSGDLKNTENFTAQDGTSKIAIYDVDGVNGNDLIAINEFTNKITFYKRETVGWATVQNLTTGGKPTGLSIGQIEGSTWMAVSNSDDSNVVLYKWSGGAWTGPTYVDSGNQPNDVFIADANNDGTADIITADLGTSSVSIIPRESGTWGSRLQRSVGSQPHSLWAEDVDGDSSIDIITSNYGFAQISILRWVDNIEPTTTGIPNSFSLNEDTDSNNSFIDLWKYFEDTETSDASLDFSVNNGSDDIISAEIALGRYLNIKIGPLGKNWNGERIIKIMCTDEKGGSTNGSFKILITPVNDAPEILSLAGYDIDSDSITLNGKGFHSIEDQWYNRSLEYLDADGDQVTFSTNISEGSANPHPRFGINPNTGNISYYPNNDEARVGTLLFNLSAKDTKNGLSWVNVVLGVENVNDRPEIIPIGSPPGILTAYENDPFEYQVIGTDIDGDILTFSDDSSMFQISPSGLISFTPATQDIGIHKFNITANDNRGGIREESVDLTVRNSNDPPGTPVILEPSPEEFFYINEKVSFIADTGFDPDLIYGDKLIYIWDFGDGISVVGRNQTYVFKQKGIYNVSLSLEDSTGNRITTSIDITIKGSEHIPPASLTEKTINDRFNDVNIFQVSISGNTIGEKPSIDISDLRTTRSGTNIVATLTMAGNIANDVSYEVYIVIKNFRENDYVYIGTGSLPRPNLPIEGEDYIYRGTYNEDLNIIEGNPQKTSANSIKFTLPLPEITTPGGFDFFAVAYYRDDMIFRIDSVGNGSNDPSNNLLGDDDDDDDTGGIWYFWYVIFGLTSIIIIMIVLIVVVAIVSSNKKLKSEKERSKNDDLPPPPPPEIDAEVELLNPDEIIPAEDLAPPPPEDINISAIGTDEIIPPQPAVVTPQQSIDQMLLPMDQIKPGKQLLQPPPNTPVTPPSQKNKGDIFDELFSSPSSEAPQSGLDVECYNCHGTIVVTNEQRPLVVKCADCGTESMLP